MKILHPSSFVFLALGLALTAGCGHPTSVSGSVTYDGQAIADGSIVFTPEDGKGPVAGGPIADGKYRITDITPGRKIVQIIGVKKINFSPDREEMQRLAKENAKRADTSGIIDRADVIPADAPGNNSVVEIVAGEQVKDFPVQRPVAKKK